MKKYMIGAAAVVALVLVNRAQKIKAAENRISEPAMSQSSDWQGDLWARLAGADLGNFSGVTESPSHLQVVNWCGTGS